MSKKKKKVVTVQEESPILYSGKVIIKKIKKGKVVSTTVSHNLGTRHLFNFLLNCLAGNWLSKSMPQWVTTGMYHSDTNKTTYVADTMSAISQAPTVYNTDTDSPYIEYRFLLPQKEEYKNPGFNALILYSDDNKPLNVVNGEEIDPAYSMQVLLDEVHQAELEQILIIWQLKILNKE